MVESREQLLQEEIAQLKRRICALEADAVASPTTRDWAPHFAVTDELEQLLASISDYLWSAQVHEDGRFEYRYYSPVVERITGRPPSYYLDGGWLDTLHPDDVSRVRAAAGRLLAGEVSVIEEHYRIYLPNGQLRWLRDRVIRVIRADGAVLVNGIVRDVSDQVEAEERQRQIQLQMQQAQRLESLGLLAGGVAHDFNNLLVGVLGSLDLAFADLPEDEPARIDLQLAESAAMQCAELCRQLLAYSGRGQFVIESFSLPELVEDMDRLLGITINKAHTISYDFGQQIPALSGDQTQLRQVVMNLITNASDAIGARRGSIQVSVQFVDAQREQLEGAIGGETLEPGPYVCLEVRDDGAGIDEHTRARIFDPFFTTKQTGHGLGLAAVLGIMRSHGGAIWVTDNPGGGTCFRLLFPPSDGVQLAPSSTPNTAAARQWSGTVLVVDDDDSVRSVTKHMLELRGFDVLLAVDGEQGVAMYAEHRDDIRLVLLDMRMPRLDGKDALAAINAINAEAKVMMMSGYSEHTLERELADERLVAFVQKPFRISTLDQVLEDLLGPQPTRS